MEIALYIALIVGLVAAVVHQLMDRAAANGKWENWVRALVVGAAASALVWFIVPDPMLKYKEIVVLFFAVGYTGDSVIVNIVHRYLPKLDDLLPMVETKAKPVEKPAEELPEVEGKGLL